MQASSLEELVVLVLYALIPVPGLLYLGVAVSLRERHHREPRETNHFATVNGMLVSMALGVCIGALPAGFYVVQFIHYLSSGPSPNETVLASLFYGGTVSMAIVTGLLSFRFRRFFQRWRVLYYLACGAACVPLVSAAYLLADYVDFTVHY